MKVLTALNLNQSPTTTKEGSLMFAKNIKLDDDGIITNDYGYETLSIGGYKISEKVTISRRIVGHIVGLNDKIYFFCHTNVEIDPTRSPNYITDIVEFNEITNSYKVLNTGWSYHYGKISGCVNTNISGEFILTIAETNAIESVPLKHINLTYCTDKDEESIYTQAPIIPMCNIKLKNMYTTTIPSGTYVFFIRYKIREGVYTNWYLASHPMFTGTSESIATLQGSVKYINEHKDSANSFILDISFVNDKYKINYKEFQIGFIISHDEAINSRIWKTFDINTTEIYFDYEAVKEENIDKMLTSTYELYNVKNVIAFKNQLYISNYNESQFESNVFKTLTNNIELNTISKPIANANSSDPIKFNGVALKYDDTIKGYTNTGAFSLLINQRYHYDYDNSKFAKIDTYEKQNIASFDLRWRASDNPDMAMIYNIKNDIYDNGYFGPSGLTNFEPRRGIEEIYYNSKSVNGHKYWIFKESSASNNTHNFYNHNPLDLPIGFARVQTAEESSNNRNDNCNEDNKSIIDIDQYNLNHGIHTISNTTYTGLGVRDMGFHIDDEIYMKDRLKKRIVKGNRVFYLYSEFSSSGKTYYYDKDTKDDNKSYLGHDAYSYDIDNITNPSDSFISQLNATTFNALQHKIVGINAYGVPILKDGSALFQASSIIHKFRKVIFSVEETTITSNDGEIHCRFNITAKVEDYSVLTNFNISKKYLSLPVITSNTTQCTTLMPFSKYDVYAHYVNNKGVISNGYKVSQLSTGNINNENLLGLDIKYNGTDTNYLFFLSLVNVGDIVIEGFDYKKIGNQHILHSIEIDALLYNINENIIIKNELGQKITTNATYHSSATTNPVEAFGNCGYITWTDNGNYSNNQLYIIIEKRVNSNNVNDQRLTKCTKYLELVKDIKHDVYDDFYGSYVCDVQKPSYELSSNVYVVGKDIYSVTRTNTINVKEFESLIQMQTTPIFKIKSNFNLNYITIQEDIDDQIFTIGNAASGVRQIAKVINSATLSFIYKLDTMYKDFRNAVFYKATGFVKETFDNTIRLSNVLSDESVNNSVYMFDPEMYYNVPTNRGIIIKLISIGNNIFVHTKASLYKFAANQNIVANESDIAIKEGDLFDNGITQVCDSEYGYAGLDNKESSCVTFDNYVFYDKANNHIFAYGGQNALQIIDYPIYKFLVSFDIANCRVMHDEPNFRIFFNFILRNNKEITISYNYKSKSFISLHDLTLLSAFSSKKICYSYKNGLYSLFKKTKDVPNRIYGDATYNNYLTDAEPDSSYADCKFSISILMFPQSNGVAILNYVNYVCNQILSNIKNKETKLVYDIARHVMINPVKEMFITTDACLSTSVTHDVDVMSRPPNPNNKLTYDGFHYDRGYWFSNYFRNKENIDNLYKYKDQPGTNLNINGASMTRTPNSDNYSLVYGRYFIITLGFKDMSFKFESINITDSNK